MSQVPENTACAACGMIVEAPAYHPHLACLAFKQVLNGNTVEGNLRSVVRYGMQAQLHGVTLDQAMRDITAVWK